MSSDRNTHKGSVAIVGMGCIFPKSSDLKEYWQLLFQGNDAITDVPATHWSAVDYYHNDPKKSDHVYCQRGGFISPVSFDPSEFGIPPAILEATDTSQLLGLVTAQKALEDAGYKQTETFCRERTSVILGVTGTQELVIPLGARLGHPIWRKALENSGISSEKTEEVIKKISDSYVSWQENSFPGLLGNIVAGRISNRLDLGGTNCVVDAACASSMSAIHLAVLELLTARSDMVITGGVDMLNDIFMHMCFSKTGVLSPTGDIRPFSKEADGTVLGEGIGLFVLKRLEDAERDNNKIYAVIRGMGSSSDGKSQSIYAPRAEGQLKALQTAYNEAGIDPATVGLVEAHGTGTRVGDVVEFQALNRLFGKTDGNRRRCALGSVKSMIGHTKAAAGAAGLIKAVLALYHKVLPPTLKVDEPDPNLNIHESAFYLNTTTRPWFSNKNHLRRSGVSAFGFGGSNFHVVLEEYHRDKQKIAWDGSVEIAAFSASTPQVLTERFHSFKTTVDNGASFQEVSIQAAKTRNDFCSSDPYRLLIVLERSMDLPQLFDRTAQALTSQGTSNPWHEKNIYYGNLKPSGKIAFVFPGQGSQYIGMGRDLVCSFPVAFNVLEDANKKYENIGCLTDFIYPPPALTAEEKKSQQDNLQKTDIAQPAIGAVSIAMQQILQGFGVHPDATCGHSFGELSALCAAGWIDLETFLNLSIERGRLMATVSRNSGAMLAVKAPLEKLADLIKASEIDVVLANKNSPQQGVLSGSITAISLAEKMCKQKGFKTIRLPVSSAFHSSLVKDAREPFKQALKTIVINPSDIPVFSNTTGSPYPDNPDDAKELLGEHLLCPVDFVSEIENLFSAGVRTYIEVGPKSVLTGLVKSILENRDHEAFALDDSGGRQFGVADLARTLSRIAALGHGVDLSCWEETRPPLRKQRMRIPIAGVNYRSQRPSDSQSDRPKAVSATRSTGRNLSIRPQHMQRSEPSLNEMYKDEKRPLQSGPSDDVVPKTKPDPDIDLKKNAMSMKRVPMTGNQELMKSKQQSFIIDALKVVQEGLKSMQALQMQTAETHQKFLETQTEASRTLQRMMENTQRLAEASLGLNTAHVVSSDLTGFDYQKEAQITPGRPSDRSLSPASAEPETTEMLIAKSDLNTAPKKSEPAQSPRDKLESSMLEVVSRLTGYPIEMLDLNMDIEADLGIDSIKRVEILSTLEEKMPGLPAVSPEIMGSLKTLGQIIAYFADTQPIATSKKEDETDSPTLSTSAADEIINPAGSPNEELHVYSHKDLAAKIERKVVAVIEKPFHQGRRTALPAGRTVFITDDNTGFSESVANEFASQNIKTVLISEDMLSEIVNGEKNLPKAAGLVIVAKNSLNHAEQRGHRSVEFLKDAFLLARHLAPDLIDSAANGGAFLATVTRLDGAFGFKGRGISNPIQGGLAGLAKTASIEWDGVCCRAIDIAPQWKANKKIARAVVSELVFPDRSEPVEIGLEADARSILTLEASPYPQGKIDLKTGEVVVVTGGARGITASAARALAKHSKPTLVLLGRSALPSPEPQWLVPLEEEAAVKKAILDNEYGNIPATPMQIEKAFKKYMANREITRNLEAIKKDGAAVLYYSVDVRNLDKVCSVLREVRSTHGPIKGIIHGAGTREDRLIVDKTVEQFENVFDPKVKGLNVLLEATKQDDLKYFVLFSSVTARMGNYGQVDYAMANEVLNKIAQQEASTRPDCRFISINWGPWDGGMVCSALKRKFEKSGIELIPMDAGAMCMIYEMQADKYAPVEVVVGANIMPAQTKNRVEATCLAATQPLESSSKEKLSLTIKREIDVDRYPILGAHILDGKPVVPFALMTEWLGHGALHENPGLLLHGFDDIRLFQGIKLDKGKKLIRLLAGKPRKKGSVFEVNVEIRDGIHNDMDVIHSRATAILTDKLKAPPAFNTFGDIASKPYTRNLDEVYEKILFHGFELRGIQEIIGYSSRGMVARISTAPSPTKWMKEPLRSKWIGDPLVLDSAFQMAIIWGFEEKSVVSLPSYSAGYRQYRNGFPSDEITVVLEVKEVSSRKIKGEFTFLDTQGVVVARLTGYEAVMDASLSRAFKARHAA